MNQENQVVSTSVQNLPLKRKRGRPRKDGSLTRVEKPTVVTIGSDTRKGKSPWNSNSGSNRDDTLLGKAVSGVLDGSFDAGYLVTVKVGETNTVLRGVVFKPEAVVPITEANDVASNVKMFKRNEIFSYVPNQLPVPAQRVEISSEPNALSSVKGITEVVSMSPSQGPASTNVVMKEAAVDINPNSEQRVLSPVKQVPEIVPISPSQGQSSTDVAMKEALIDVNQNSEQKALSPVMQVPEVVPLSPSQGQSSTAVATKEALIDINQVPHASPQAVRQAEIRTMSSSQILSGGQASDASQAVQLSSQSTYSQKSLDTVVLKNCGTSSLTGAALNDGDKSKDSKREHNPGPTDESFQGSGTNSKTPEVEHQVVEPLPEVNLKTDGALKGKSVDLNHVPIDAEPDSVAVEQVSNLIMKDKAFEDKQNFEATVDQGLTTELNGRPPCEVVMSAIEQEEESEPEFPIKQQQTEQSENEGTISN